MGSGGHCIDIVELIINELRKRKGQLLKLFSQPGQLVIHVDPSAWVVKVEVRVKV